MTSFNSVVISLNLADEWDMFPVVASAWKKLFGVSVHLAVVMTSEPTEEQKEALKPEFGLVSWIRMAEGRSCRFQTHLARYALAAALEPKTKVLLSSASLMPLSEPLIAKRFEDPMPGRVVVLGSEFYSGRMEGLFYQSPVLAEAGSLAKAFDAGPGQPWESLLRSVKGSDDWSAAEMLLYVKDGKALKFDRRLFFKSIETICCVPQPERWEVDPERLVKGGYAFANLSALGVPISDQRLKQLATAIGSSLPSKFLLA